jgi:hypothetical protein
MLMEQKMMTCETKTMKKTLLVVTKVLAVTSELCDAPATFSITVLCDNRLILQNQARKHYVTQKPA